MTGGRQRLNRTVDDVPGRNAAGSNVRADDKDRRHSASGQLPSGKPDDDGNDSGYSGKRAHAVAYPRVQQRKVFKALGSAPDDPQVGRSVIDHCRYHAPKAEIETHLHHHKNDGEDDADQSRDKTQPVLKQISRGKRCNKRHRWRYPSRRSIPAKSRRGAVRLERQSETIVVVTQRFSTRLRSGAPSPVFGTPLARS